MKAVRIHQFGGAEVLRLDEVPMPQPRDDEVVIRVTAASVNPVDYKIRSGAYPAVREDQLPMVLGRDVAGTVETCGTAAHTLRKGDPIYAALGRDRGGYAEFALVKATEAAATPARLDGVAAAAVPLAGLTAWQGLFDHGGLEAGQRVLVHGGAGGVGHFAIQFAKARGAFVATTASGGDRDFVRDLGADQAIDYKEQRFEEEVGDIDLVLDLIAGETQDRSWAVLRPGGMLVSTLAAPSPDRARAHGAHGTNFMVSPSAAQLGEIGALIDEGKVRPVVQARFPLAQVADAHRCLENEHVRGKVLLTVGS